ncbi:TetR/AcrR family transcriptional regulator [Gordonia sp. TBRC 11910]|uniref:TetR/AcrR family transcriptional regulator n=1 Tax=Gordonia asplenii TaxID=2725283 RepID=A0A848L2K5_9ACTN|nr:TetR family transcriptional regulator [Gordonia asplenii]NMO05074.1 TetR/AcrR family transcriptional regulator [Gordonia asplenii]
MTAPAFYDELRALRLERALDASVEIITEEGWGRLTMTKVAQRSGIPRQSLYKDVGTRSELGEAVVTREADRFLTGMRDAIAAHPGAVADAVGAAARFALVYGESNVLLKAVLQGHDVELLELLTVRPEAVLAQATRALSEALGDPPESLVDTMIRLVLSHLLQPTVSIDEAVARIVRAVSP